MVAEHAHAVGSMPLAFAEDKGNYLLVAVLSPVAGQNLFVASDGRWLGGYVPAMFRGYPFRLLRKPGTTEWVFCVEEAMTSPAEAYPAGEAFFDAEGKLAPPVQKIFDFLSKIAHLGAATNAAVAALAAAGALRPWPIKYKAGEQEQTSAGLYYVDEAALNSLSDEAHLKLRKAGALVIAHAQLLSMPRIAVFQELSKLHGQLAQLQPAQQPKTPGRTAGIARPAVRITE